jgi:hypothetical protein
VRIIAVMHACGEVLKFYPGFFNIRQITKHLSHAASEFDQSCNLVAHLILFARFVGGIAPPISRAYGAVAQRDDGFPLTLSRTQECVCLFLLASCIARRALS